MSNTHSIKPQNAIKLFLINSGSNIGISVFFNLISLFTLPLFVNTYSSSLYGVFILATGLTDSLTTFDFGVNNALMRYTAEFTADGNRKRYASFLSGTMMTAAILGLCFSIFMIIMSFFAVSAFNIESHYALLTVKIFRLSAIYAFIIIMLQTTQSILEGHYLFYWRNISRIPMAAIIITLYFYLKNNTLPFQWFVVIMMISRIIPGFVNLVVIFKKGLLKDIRLVKDFSWNTLKDEFVPYSANLFLLQIIAFCTFQADKLIVGFILPTAFVTIYTVITKPMFIIRMVNNQTLAVLGPMFAKEGRKENKDLIKKIIRQGNTIHAMLIYPMIGILALFMKPFIGIWMPDFTEYAYWGGIAGLIFLFAPFYSLLSRFMVYTGKVKAVRNISFWTVLVNVVVSIICTHMWGFGGVIIGSMAQVIVQAPVYIQSAKREYNFSVGDMVQKEMAYVSIYSLAVFAAAYYIMENFIIIDSWPVFIVMLAVVTVISYLYSTVLFIKLSGQFDSSVLNPIGGKTGDDLGVERT